MTGYGAASSHADGTDYHVELRTVNNRYFKIGLRMPDPLQPLEAEVELLLRKRLSRGSVNVRVTMAESSERAAYEINAPALRRYLDEINGAWPEGYDRPAIDVASLLSLPGVLQAPGDEGERHERARGALLPLVERACDDLLEMREREGKALGHDLLALSREIGSRVAEIEKRAPDVATQYAERLRSRIEALLEDATLATEPAELIREVAVYAERVDVAEEITRLRTHIDQFEQRVTDGNGDPVGRTLEFLGQEMLREANTIASKSPDADVSRLAVEIKGYIDRIKEQTQNVE
ncbi:MAG: YicC family protein [Phycisphaerae bacterium]|nr:YicC family protein [Phycisphaerae bacterium]